jgi:Protein of unknown function (DUF2628)
MSERPGLFDFAGQKAHAIELWQRSSWNETALFIGPNAERFRGAWEATRAKMEQGRSGRAFGFCLPALVFGFAWFLYRKMWAAGILLLVLPVGLAFLFDSGGGGIGLGIAMSLFAKTLYVQHAVTKIDALRDAGADDEAIAAAGGTSLAGAIVGGAILAAGTASVVYLLMSGAAA